MIVEITKPYAVVMENVFGVVKKSIEGRTDGRAGNATDGGVMIAVSETTIVKNVIQTQKKKI
jgi:hypothetical protein